MTMFAKDLFAGQTALVTGASSGLGAHFAMLLASHGAQVTAAARRIEALQALVARIRASGGEAEARPLDVRDTASVDRLFAAAPPFDVVINNAGVAMTKKLADTDDADWQQVIDTNLTGAFRVARAAARTRAPGERGTSIVNVASILAFRVAKQVAAYIAAKAALVRLTEALALELAPQRIRVNAIAPGYIETDLNADFLASPAGETMVKRVALRRFGVPADLDGALLLLASRAGAYITGTTVIVDGGHGLAWL